jgi:phosphoglycolate phosphatase
VERGRAPLPLSTIRPVVSLGGAALIRLAFGIGADDPDFTPIRDRFLECYAAGVAEETTLFPGIASLLERLEEMEYRWGIVTNKSGWLTSPLVEALGLAGRAACVVAGDTTSHSKPHPAPLLHACRLLQCEPARTVYIGDARRDVEAGRGAGLATVIATYGYIPADEDAADWGADALIDAPHELLPWLQGAD